MSRMVDLSTASPAIALGPLDGRYRAVAAPLADAGVLVRAFPEGLRITATTAEETERLLAAWETLNNKTPGS